MGFTPLEGLVMGTRCGSIDPALVPYIMEREKLGTKEIDSIMNKNSGMLGLTETSNDMREIEQEAARGSERHRLAIDIYCYHVRKYIGAYMAALGGVDAIVFTGGIGENSPPGPPPRLRGHGRDLGIAVDRGQERDATSATSAPGAVKVLVIPTNEELAIARDTQAASWSRWAARPRRPPTPAARGKAEGSRPTRRPSSSCSGPRAPRPEPQPWPRSSGRALGRTSWPRRRPGELERLSLISPRAPGRKTAEGEIKEPSWISSTAKKPAGSWPWPG